MISIDAVMSTAVLTVKDSDTVSEADARMRAAGVRHLPVTDTHNRVIGVISSRDVAGARTRGRVKRVGEVMSRNVKTVRLDDPADKAVQLMLEHKIGSLPVVADDETLVGIVTETDFLRIAHEALTLGRQRGTNHAAGPETP